MTDATITPLIGAGGRRLDVEVGEGELFEEACVRLLEEHLVASEGADENGTSAALLWENVVRGVCAEGLKEIRVRAEGWPADRFERMSALAERFPSLRDHPGVRPFEPEALEERLRARPWPDAQQRAAIRFVLAVYDSRHPFDPVRALSVWDVAHREAFIAWAKRPFWFRR